jgi:hypothetical protein
VLAALLLSVPLLSHAQATEPAPQPKLYAGLAAYISSSQSINSASTGFPVPLQATLGYQLLPRLAVQASLAYRGTSASYSYAFRDYYSNNSTGSPYTISGVNQQRSSSAAVLTRLTLTRQATHRLQFDLLAGLTLEHQRYRWTSMRTDSAAAPVASSNRTSTTLLLVTAGAGVRYRIGQRFEANYNLLLSTGIVDFNNRNSYYYRASSSMALGLQYRFGRR